MASERLLKAAKGLTDAEIEAIAEQAYYAIPVDSGKHKDKTVRAVAAAIRGALSRKPVPVNLNREVIERVVALLEGRHDHLTGTEHWNLSHQLAAELRALLQPPTEAQVEELAKVLFGARIKCVMESQGLKVMPHDTWENADEDERAQGLSMARAAMEWRGHGTE